MRYALRLAAGFGSQISMVLLRWTPVPDGVHRRPAELGYEYRIVDRSAWRGGWRRSAAPTTPTSRSSSGGCGWSIPDRRRPSAPAASPSRRAGARSGRRGPTRSAPEPAPVTDPGRRRCGVRRVRRWPQTGRRASTGRGRLARSAGRARWEAEPRRRSSRTRGAHAARALAGGARADPRRRPVHGGWRPRCSPWWPTRPATPPTCWTSTSTSRPTSASTPSSRPRCSP